MVREDSRVEFYRVTDLGTSPFTPSGGGAGGDYPRTANIAGSISMYVNVANTVGVTVQSIIEPTAITFNQVTLTGAADQVVGADSTRRFLVLTNTSAINQMFLGNNTVTVANGHVLLPNSTQAWREVGSTIYVIGTLGDVLSYLAS